MEERYHLNYSTDYFKAMAPVLCFILLGLPDLDHKLLGRPIRSVFSEGEFQERAPSILPAVYVTTTGPFLV